MSVLALVEVNVKPEYVSAYKSLMEELFPGTRAFKGCLRAELHTNQDDETNMIGIEEWETREDHQKYTAWRVEAGTLASVGPMLAAPPSVRYFDKTDA